MSIASRITAIEGHIGDIYDTMALGGDTTQNKNIVNINTEIKREYKDFLANGTDVLWNNWEKVSGTGTELSLNNTMEGKMKVDLKGNTSQESTTGKNLFDSGTALIEDFLTPNNVAYTISGGVYTVNGSNIHPYSYLRQNLELEAGTYILTGCPSGGSNDGYSAIVKVGQTSYFDYGDGVLFTLDTSQEVYVYPMRTGSSIISLNNVEFKPMIRKSDVSDTTFEPYTGGIASPNPDYPQDIQVVSGDNTIKVEGKNLVNVANKSGSLSSQYYQDYETGYTLEVGKTYTLSLNANVSVTPFLLSVGAGEAGYVRNIYTEGGKQNGRVSITFTPTSADLENATKLFIRCPRYNSATTTTYTLSDIMLELGNQATSYEPYQSQTYPISLGNIELCKIGTYQDSIVKDNGKWYLNKQIGKVVLDGSEDENWDRWGNLNENIYSFASNILLNIIKPPLNNDTNGEVYCNYYLPTTINNIYQRNMEGIAVQQSTWLRIMNDDLKTSSLTDWKTWLTTHNTNVYYVLATPTYTEITDTTLLSQLEALAYSYDEQTNISQVNDDMPFVLDITALKEMA